MNIPLLKTKFYIPSPRPDAVTEIRTNQVPRPRLLERLDEGFHLGRRLTLLSAPAGFGKTTLLSEWVHQNECPISWLSIDAGDNDLVRFFTYLVAALQRGYETVGQAAQSLLEMQPTPPVEALMTVLINDLTELPDRFVLVLDDYQLIQSPSIHQAIAFLLEHQPTALHLIIATRSDPPLPLHRLRVRGQMTEIRADDLRFTTREAAEFLNQVLGLSLAPEMIATLETRTEGWIAGLQLAALSLQNKEDIAAFIDSFSGSHRHIIAYLAQEVLAQQPEDRREFLCQTSILDRFTASLCNAVTGRQDSAAVLSALEQANLFLMPLDEEGQWFRYHRLFADFLQTELEPQSEAQLHLAAAHWFEQQNLLAEAVRYILAYTAISADWASAVSILSEAIYQEFYKGSYGTVLGWLGAIPDEIVHVDSRLASCKAASLLMTGQPETGKAYLRSAEQNLPVDAPAAYRGMLLGLHCYSRAPDEVPQLAQKALDLIGDTDPIARSNVLFMLGDAQDAIGDVAGAIQSFEEVVALGQQYGNQMAAAVAQGHLAISLNEQGKRRQAVTLCQSGIERYVDAHGRALPIASMFYVTLGRLERETNNLTQAREHIEQGLELGRQSATTRMIVYALEELALLEGAFGETDAALRTIDEARQLASQTGERSLWVRALHADQAGFYLLRGDMLAAARWAGGAGFPASPVSEHKYEYPVYTRLLLAQNNATEAHRLLTKLKLITWEDQRYRQWLTFSIQHALAAYLLQAEAEALSYLEAALYFAFPEGYCQAFMDEGPLVADLLPKVRSVAPAFVDQLLKTFIPQLAGTVSLLPESLSDREIQVLRLMADGLTSPQIAKELIIAVSTVRSHRKHIYRKLAAHSRYEAVERAKNLGLL